MQQTWIPNGAMSTRKPCENATAACLEALYAVDVLGRSQRSTFKWGHNITAMDGIKRLTCS